VTLEDLTRWANLTNPLEEISFLPYLHANDAPPKTENVYALATLLKHTTKHIWLQPYSSGSVEHLIAFGAAAAGAHQALADNPVIRRFFIHWKGR
jgi:hypothetical protein